MRFKAVGVPWSPTEFVQQARLAQHPFLKKSKATDLSRRSIFEILVSGRYTVQKRRDAAIRHWRQRRDELKEEEAKLHREMHRDVEAVVAGPRRAVTGV